ncbi:MAG: carboxypeptidase M32 [Anaerolineales bacterium]|nr:carboxypeptidase M32 [Anaerolineales bacterium]
MQEKLNELKHRLAEIADLEYTMSLLAWDQEANMPPEGAEARGHQLATVSKIAHEISTSKDLGTLLNDLQKVQESLDPDCDDARLIKVATRNFEKETKLPSEMVAEKARISTSAYQAWVKARQASDFSLFQDELDKVVDWSRRLAEIFAPYEHVYDPLLDLYEPGMRTKEVQAIFDSIRPKQAALIHEIADKEEVDDSFLHQYFDEGKQKAFGREMVTKIGYDWERGTEGNVVHPFMTTIGFGDIRINTKVEDNFFNPYLFGAMHEAGHAIYEQGIGKEKARTPLFSGASLALHESQSRMFENLIGRSKAFWEGNYTRLQEFFPAELGNVSLDHFYKGINKVMPSFIRIEADEATYNMHIMLRLEIEIGLMDGSILPKDLPEIWNNRMEKYLGITPANDAEGVLQDVHWSHCLIGYFSTYALGNLISVQLWNKMQEALPNREEMIRKGDFTPILAWLKENIYKYGAKFEPQELVEKVTGSKINGEPYLNYLHQKFGNIYSL